MSAYVASANPDSVTEGLLNTDHTLEFPFIDTDKGALIRFKTPSTNTGTIKFNARGNASASDNAVAASGEVSVQCWRYQPVSFYKSVSADQFSYEVLGS